MPSIRVLLALDHRLFQAGLRSLLAKISDVEVVAEAEDGHAALRAAAKHQPDVLLIDYLMPGLNGLDVTAQVTKTHPKTRVVFVSLLSSEDSVLQALRAGAVGYIGSSADPAELELAIRAAIRGEMFLSAAISKPIIEEYMHRVGSQRTSLERLSPRLREVLQMIAEGSSTKEIAQKLGITGRTIDTYRTELMKTLNIHDIAGLTRYAVHMGLVSR